MRVAEIIDPSIKSGTNKKGQPWSQAKVKLEDGTVAYIFNPIKVNDVVESYENNGYTNWKVVQDAAEAPKVEVGTRPAAPTPQLDRIEEQLQEVNSKLDKLMGVDGSFIPDEEL